MFESFRPNAARKSLSIVAAASLLAMGLAGCSSTTDATSSSDSATSGTVNWWGWSPTDAATADAYIAEFNNAYPNIKVNYKLVPIANWVAALRPALASSSGPDVFDMQPGSYVTQFKSYAEDLTPVAESALGSDWKSKVTPIGISGLTADNKLTALSVGSTFAGGLWINKGLFDKYGITPPTTLDEWTKACELFSAQGQGCFVQGASQEGFDQDTLQAIANSVKPGLWTAASKGEAKWNDPDMVNTFSVWKRLFTDKIMQPGAIGAQQYPEANNDFLTGKAAMVMMGTWYTQYATEKAMTAALSSAGVAGAKPFPIVPLAFPDVAGKGTKGQMFGDSDFGLAVASKSKVRAAAETFVKWMTTSKEGQQVVANQLNDLPALSTVQPDFNEIKFVDPAIQKAPVQELLQKVSTVDQPRFALISNDVQTAILAAATSVASGSATPQQAADTLQQAAEAAGVTFK